MAGKPFKVGRFAHTLRVRLMREHAGIDVDAINEDDLMANAPTKPEHQAEEEVLDPGADQERAGVTHAGEAAVTALARTGMEGIGQGESGFFPQQL